MRSALAANILLAAPAVADADMPVGGRVLEGGVVRCILSSCYPFHALLGVAGATNRSNQKVRCHYIQTALICVSEV
jgi:hypothetical protein